MCTIDFNVMVCGRNDDLKSNYLNNKKKCFVIKNDDRWFVKQIFTREK